MGQARRGGGFAWEVCGWSPGMATRGSLSSLTRGTGTGQCSAAGGQGWQGGARRQEGVSVCLPVAGGQAPRLLCRLPATIERSSGHRLPGPLPSVMAPPNDKIGPTNTGHMCRDSTARFRPGAGQGHQAAARTLLQPATRCDTVTWVPRV
ncbi:MAG: hypothetical protein WDW36_004544 [Sanguina aurantia]